MSFMQYFNLICNKATIDSVLVDYYIAMSKSRSESGSILEKVQFGWPFKMPKLNLSSCFFGLLAFNERAQTCGS
jgi:hypothetical protein